MSGPLFSRFPEISGKISWMSLGRFPTRVHRLERLGADTGARELWIKRDDESGLEYGGNKVRKLEFLLADARARGVTRLYAVGGLGSNFMVASAIYGAAEGLEVHMAAVPQEMNEHARNNLRAALAAGASVDVVSRRAGIPLRMLSSFVRHRHAANGVNPYYLLPGGSSPLGTLGYVGAALELKEQIDQGELPEPEIIVVPLGSGGTLAGLTLGVRLAGLGSRVVGVRVVERSMANATATALLADATALRLRRAGARLPRMVLRPSEVEVMHEYFGGAYGRSSPASKDAVRRMHELEGIELETTYTGKALAGLFHLIREGRLHYRPILFWNTVSSVELAPLLARAPRREDVPAAIRRYYD